MTETLTYVVGVDQGIGVITPLWHISSDDAIETECGVWVCGTHCGKRVRVVMQSDADPGDEDLCAACWRAVRQ